MMLDNDGDELNFQSRHDIVDKKKYSILKGTVHFVWFMVKICLDCIVS